ncbi:MAG: hypothetical protein ACSHX4_08055 [Opitutaceae bacterium]
MKNTTESTLDNSANDTSCTTHSCRTGSCGGPGLCPGIAILLAYVLGSSIALLTGLTWLGWVIGIPAAIILITGAWHYIPGISKNRRDQ